MADPDPGHEALHPAYPAPLAIRKRSSGPLPPSNQTKSSYAGGGKLSSSGQIKSSAAASVTSSDYPNSLQL